MTALLSNNAISKLAAALTSGATALSVTSGEGSKFPAPTGGSWFPLTLSKASGVREILRCTARTGDVLTVTRAQEGTAAVAFDAGDRVELRMTAAVISEINAAMAAVVQDLADTITSLGLTAAVTAFARSTAPAGWLKCNGDAVSRTTYATLFAAIGTTFGVGDGSTTFNLPEMRGETARGWDDGRGVDTGRALGSAQAAQNLSHTHTGTTTSDSHTHTWSGTTSSSGAHTHDVNRAANNGAGGAYDRVAAASGSNSVATDAAASNGAHTHTVSGTTSSDSHTHTFTTAANGGTDMRVRNIALLYCIKY